MQESLEKIKIVIESKLVDRKIIVDKIEYVKENKYNFLKITLDKVGGLDLDQVAYATKIINPIIDEYDLIKEEYILDISSKERG
ncbi:MAG: ribosome maturation factor RimP [Bacilli bacterium]|nr:ribosome maturation factor RimP [Bacilli bacterium]